MATLTAAADGSHMSGAMIALMPTAEDAERLAIEGGEPADQLHLTLRYLGKGADFDEAARAAIVDSVRMLAEGVPPITSKIFGAAHWNGNSDEPSWVWSVGDDPDHGRSLEAAHGMAEEALMMSGSKVELPEQHTPYVPHVCAIYSDELDLIIALEERLGPVTFDRVRVVFAGDHTDIPLGESTTGSARGEASPLQIEVETNRGGKLALGAIRAALKGHLRIPHQVTGRVRTESVTAAADGPMRRKPTELELASRVDFAQMDTAWHEAVDTTVDAWTDIQEAQRKEITAAVQAAAEADDLDQLDTLTVDTDAGAELLTARMLAYAQAAGEAQQAEAEAQGVTIPEWSLDDEALTAAAIRDRLRQIGRTTARVLGAGLVQSAVRQAMRLWGSGTGEEIATQVAEFLAGLSGAAVEEQVGAAMSAAQNEGRIAVLAVAPPATYLGSEIFDKNSCLAPEVMVTTRDGLVPAKDVTLKDELLTHSGRWVQPSRIVVSHVEEELTRVHLADDRSLRLTWDHPVLVHAGEGFTWRNAGDLAVGDLVVDQSTFELGGELGGVDLDLGQTPHDVSAVGEIGILSAIDVRAQRVPVGAVRLDDETVPDEEVSNPGAYLGLDAVGVLQVFEGLSDAALDAGLSTAGEVATPRTITSPSHLGRNDAELSVAVRAVDEYGRSAAGLRAVGLPHELGVPEGSSASLADGVASSGVQAAFDGAVGVTGVVGDRNAELDVAVGADLRDPVARGPELGAHLRVGELALLRAVHGAGPVRASDLIATQLAERRRPVRVASQPSRLDRTALAERATLDRDAARRTRLIHDLSVQIEEPKCLVITGIEREQYGGEVYDFTVPEEETFWAEGVLVHNCVPCRAVDGAEYATLAEARAAYPSGGYINCLGGSRCRGTLVTVWPPGGEQNATGMILAASGDTMPPTTTDEGGGPVPYSIVRDHPDCGADTPWAVIKDADDSLMGCHGTEEGAEAQRRTLYAEDGDEPPDDMQRRRPDDEDDMDYTGKTAPWRGPLVVEGKVTGDGREFAPEALTWADLPVPLRWNKEDSHGGEARTIAVNVGRIDNIWRAGDLIMGEGVLDLSDDDGQRVHAKIEGKFLRGVSIDADSIADEDVEFVWPDDATDGMDEDGDLLEMLFAQPEKMIFHGGRIRAATLVDIPAFAEAYIALLDEDGAVIAGGQPLTAEERQALVVQELGAVGTHDTATSDGDWDEGPNSKRLDSPLTLAKVRAAYAWFDGGAVEDDELPKSAAKFLHHEINEDGTVGPANLTACSATIGALHGARSGTNIPDADRRGVYDHVAKHLRDAGREPEPFRSLAPVTASADVFRPPAAWFTDPGLSLPTPITITDDGRIYGHAAQWGSCHIGQEGVCVQPPHEEQHPYYRTGEVACADGTRVAVGQITVGTGHAPLNLGASPAAEHYDNTGAAVADVAVGNDRHGIWVAGAVRPGVDPLKVYELQAAGQVSGDWRRIGGQLRLVGLLAVNVPGFPVPKMRARVASGQPQALLAAGRPTVAWGLSEEETQRQAVRIVMRMLSRRVHPGGR